MISYISICTSLNIFIYTHGYICIKKNYIDCQREFYSQSSCWSSHWTQTCSLCRTEGRWKSHKLKHTEHRDSEFGAELRWWYRKGVRLWNRLLTVCEWGITFFFLHFLLTLHSNRIAQTSTLECNSFIVVRLNRQIGQKKNWETRGHKHTDRQQMTEDTEEVALLKRLLSLKQTFSPLSKCFPWPLSLIR